MKTITGILLGILLISCVYAINITAGESYSFLLSEPYSYYEVTGNQTELDLDIQQNEKNVTIYFGKYIKSDNFTIIFYNWKDEVIYSSGGGGSCSYDKDFDWNCSEWSICENEIQTRICKEYNNCHNTYKKPNETQFCIEPSKINDTVDIDIDIDEPEPLETNKNLILIAVLILGALILLRGYFIKKSKLKKVEKKVEEEEKVEEGEEEEEE